jgi:hypothetical protein
VQDVINNIPAGVLRNPTEKMVRKFVNSAITATIASAWTSLSEASKSMKSTLEEQATQLLTPLFDEEIRLKNEITTKVNDKITPFLTDSSEKICQPLLKLCINPILKIYLTCIEDFANYMKNNIHNNDYIKDKLDISIRRDHVSTDYWYSGPLENANKLCWDLYKSELHKIEAIFNGNYNTYSLYSDTLDSIRDLTHRGIHAFYIALHNNEDANINEVIIDVLKRYTHDSILAMISILETILANLLQTPMETLVITPSLKLVEPIQEIINSIPIPGVSDLFNLETLTEEVLRKILDDSISTIVASSTSQVEEKINEVGDKVTQVLVV